MKQSLTILIFLITFSGKAQYSNDVNAFRKETTVPVKLPKQYKQETTQTKIRFLRKMYNDTSSVFCQGKLSAESFGEFRNRYDTALYVHDFDADGDYDILFFGRLCPGYENTNALLFFKKGKEYTPQHLGTWIVKMDLTRKTTELAVLKTPCCDDYQLEFMYYENVKGLEDSLAQYTHQVFGLDYFKDPPKSIDTSLSITRKLDVVMAPDLTAEEYNQVLKSGGNPIIGTLIPGVSLKAYNSYTFGGKTWYYIIANVNTEIKLNEGWNHSSFGEINSVRGWICLDS